MNENGLLFRVSLDLERLQINLPTYRKRSKAAHVLLITMMTRLCIFPAFIVCFQCLLSNVTAHPKSKSKLYRSPTTTLQPSPTSEPWDGSPTTTRKPTAVSPTVIDISTATARPSGKPPSTITGLPVYTSVSPTLSPAGNKVTNAPVNPNPTSVPRPSGKPSFTNAPVNPNPTSVPRPSGKPSFTNAPVSYSPTNDPPISYPPPSVEQSFAPTYSPSTPICKSSSNGDYGLLSPSLVYVSYKYKIQIDESVAIGQVLSDLEPLITDVILPTLFSGNCASSSVRRILQGSALSPVGVSGLPGDIAMASNECTYLIPGAKCFSVNGLLSVYFSEDVQYSSALENLIANIRDSIKTSMSNGVLLSSNPQIKYLAYDDTVEANPIIRPVTMKSDPFPTYGYIIIIILFLMIVMLLAKIRRKRQPKNNAIEDRDLEDGDKLSVETEIDPALYAIDHQVLDIPYDEKAVDNIDIFIEETAAKEKDDACDREENFPPYDEEAFDKSINFFRGDNSGFTLLYTGKEMESQNSQNEESVSVSESESNAVEQSVQSLVEDGQPLLFLQSSHDLVNKSCSSSLESKPDEDKLDESAASAPSHVYDSIGNGIDANEVRTNAVLNDCVIANQEFACEIIKEETTMVHELDEQVVIEDASALSEDFNDQSCDALQDSNPSLSDYEKVDGCAEVTATYQVDGPLCNNETQTCESRTELSAIADQDCQAEHLAGSTTVSERELVAPIEPKDYNDISSNRGFNDNERLDLCDEAVPMFHSEDELEHQVVTMEEEDDKTFDSIQESNPSFIYHKCEGPSSINIKQDEDNIRVNSAEDIGKSPQVLEDVEDSPLCDGIFSDKATLCRTVHPQSHTDETVESCTLALNTDTEEMNHHYSIPTKTLLESDYNTYEYIGEESIGKHPQCDVTVSSTE